MAIAELQEADKRHEEAILRHEQHLARLDSCMEEMRMTLATREDIRDLRADLRDRFDHYRARMDALDDDHQERSAARDTNHFKIMNWVMVALFVFEVGIAIAQYQWMRSHA